jgi:hypothetical protein
VRFGWYRKISNHDRPSPWELLAPVAGLFNLSLNFYSVAVILVTGKEGSRSREMAAPGDAGLQHQGSEGALSRPVAGCECWSMRLLGVLQCCNFPGGLRCSCLIRLFNFSGPVEHF